MTSPFPLDTVRRVTEHSLSRCLENLQGHPHRVLLCQSVPVGTRWRSGLADKRVQSSLARRRGTVETQAGWQMDPSSQQTAGAGPVEYQ